jgi:hypothetical protein
MALGKAEGGNCAVGGFDVFRLRSFASARRARSASTLSLRVVGKELRRFKVVLVYEDQRRALGKNVVSAVVLVEGSSCGVRGRKVSARSRLGFFFGGKGILKALEEVEGRCEAEEEGREGSVLETSFRGEGGRLRGGSVEPLVMTWEWVPLGRTAGDDDGSAGESPFMPFRAMARPLPAGSRPETSFSSAVVIEALGSGGAQLGDRLKSRSAVASAFMGNRSLRQLEIESFMARIKSH